MTTAMWVVVGLLLVVLVALHVVGARALDSFGVRPSRAVIALRVANVVAAVAVVVFAFWKWMVG